MPLLDIAVLVGLRNLDAATFFMVFGEPDVDIKRRKNGLIIVEIKGVDVYDPTTGQIRSASTDDIACWFIDTNYNGESFFVRAIFFFTAHTSEKIGTFASLLERQSLFFEQHGW